MLLSSAASANLGYYSALRKPTTTNREGKSNIGSGQAPA
jgi:hypothetical protein